MKLAGKQTKEANVFVRCVPRNGNSDEVAAYVLVYLKCRNKGLFIMLSMITNISNKKTKRPTLMELFTATGKIKKVFFFLTTGDVRCVHHG